MEPKLKYITYDQFNFLVLDLFKRLYESDIKYDFVIAPSRGGLLAGVILSHKLDIPLIPFEYSLRDRHERKFPPEVVGYLSRGMNILFVDDINDTGITVQAIKHLLQHITREDHKITYAAVYERYNTLSPSDLYAEKINDDSWIVFPWE